MSTVKCKEQDDPAGNYLNPFYLVRTLRNYSADKATHDFKAGLNVALLAFPQGMAYAAIAGLPIQYGIYGSAVAAVFGTLLAGSRFIMLGPTNATSVLLFSTFLSAGIAPDQQLLLMPLVLLVASLILIAGAFLKVASLIQFVSRAVIAGYITAAALYIIVNQFRKVIGIQFDIPEGSTFFDVIGLTLTHLPEFHSNTIILAALTTVIYVLLQKKLPLFPNVAITLLLSSLLWTIIETTAPGMASAGGAVQKLATVNADAWSITLPKIDLKSIQLIALVAPAIAFLSVLEGVSIGKTLAAQAGTRLNSNQEMLSMGVANLGCAFLSGMPASGSLTRSQLNWSSGARTQLSSFYCGALCCIGAFVLGPYTHFIPVASLGVVVIGIGLSLLNMHTIRIIVKSTRSDAFVFLSTFIAALVLRLDYAILTGAALSILLFLRKAAAPELVEYGFTEEGHLAQLGKEQRRADPEVSIIHVEGDLFFASSEMFRDQLRRIAGDPNLKVLILKMRNALHIDATSVLAMEELVHSMNNSNRYLILSEVRPEVKRVLDNSGLSDLIEADNILPDVAENPTLSTAKAVKQASKLMGGQKSHVSIYVNPAKSKPPSERE